MYKPNTFAALAGLLSATLLAVGCRDSLAPERDHLGVPAFSHGGAHPRITGLGAIGTGRATPGSDRQEFDFDAAADLTGRLFFRDWTVVRSDGTVGTVTVDTDPATGITAFRDGSQFCTADPTRGVEFDGTGRLDTGGSVTFTVVACDHGAAGSGADFFGIAFPSIAQPTYAPSGSLTEGDIVKEAAEPPPTTTPGVRITGLGVIGTGSATPGSDRWEFDFEATSAPTGRVTLTAYSVLRSDGSVGRMMVDAATDPETGVTSFSQPSAACVTFGGMARLDTGELMRFVIDACDNASPGVGADSFAVALPDRPFSHGGTLSAGDIAITISTAARVAGFGAIGTGSATPGSDRQEFDFDVAVDLTGRLFFQDWTVVRSDGTVGTVTVDTDPATGIIAFRDGSAACADPTRGAEVDGTGRLDTGLLVDFTVAGCDNGAADSGTDFFRFAIVAIGYSRSGFLSAGDIVKGAAAPPPPATATRLAFTVHPSNAGAGSTISPAVQVAAQDDAGNTVTSFTGTVTVAIGTNPAGGALSGTTTVAALNGVASFSDLSIDQPGTGYTLTASASGLTGATSTVFNITAPPPTATRLAFVVQPSSTTAGSTISPAVQVTAQDDAGNTATGFTGTVTVAIGTNPGGGTLSGTTTVAAVSGVATFSNLSIDKKGDGYTLTASASGLTGATSTAFDITPAAASVLVFTGQPSNTTAGAAISPAVQITARDAFGNTATGFTGAVTVAIGSNPSGGSLSGTKAVTAVSGVAMFADLSIDKAGSGYQLTATATGLTGATSTAFDVAAGSVSATLSSLTASPTTITAGSGSSTITVTARDAFGNPVSGATVVLAATGSGNTLTQPASPTNSSGVATGTLSSTVAGSKTVSATVNGVAVTQTATVTVNQAPTAAFTFTCSGLTCTFTDGSSDPDGWIAGWQWSFGDGTSSTAQNPSHTYAAGGTYTVRLTVIDNRGATGTVSKSVTVTAPNRPPTVNAGSDETVLLGLLYTLSWSFSDPDNGPWSYKIEWGDGTSTSGTKSSQGTFTASHDYLLIGQYQIRVTVVDSHGASGSDTKVLTVLAKIGL